MPKTPAAAAIDRSFEVMMDTCWNATPVPTKDCAEPANIKSQRVRDRVACLTVHEYSVDWLLLFSALFFCTVSGLMLGSPSGSNPIDSGLVRTKMIAGSINNTHPVIAIATHAFLQPNSSIRVAPKNGYIPLATAPPKAMNASAMARFRTNQMDTMVDGIRLNAPCPIVRIMAKPKNSCHGVLT